MTRRTSRKIPCITEEEASTSPRYAEKETIAKTAKASARQIDKTSEPEPCICSFHAVRKVTTNRSNRTMKSTIASRVPIGRNVLQSWDEDKSNLD